MKMIFLKYPWRNLSEDKFLIRLTKMAARNRRHRTYPSVVQPADPCHLIACLKFFRHALALGHLVYQSGEHHFGLLVNVSQVAVQLVAQQQAGVASLEVFLDAPQVSLTPRPMGCYSSAGNVRQGM